MGTSRAVDALRRLLLLASLAVFLAGLEGRVVFYSLGQYIHLAPPWNYLAATVVLYGIAALVLLHFAGALGEETEGGWVGRGNKGAGQGTALHGHAAAAGCSTVRTCSCLAAFPGKCSGRARARHVHVGQR